MFFRDYLNKRLKDEAFRREYKAVERNEARKASRTRKSQAKLHSRKRNKKLSGHD